MAAAEELGQSMRDAQLAVLVAAGAASAGCDCECELCSALYGTVQAYSAVAHELAVRSGATTADVAEVSNKVFLSRFQE